MVLTALTSLAARCVSVTAALVSVPLTLHYLGADRYGLWIAISSVIALLGITDFGFGNGLVNEIARAHGRNDRDMARSSISSALALLVGVAAMLGGALALAYPSIPWARVFNVSSSEAAADAGPAMAVFAACFLAGLPLSIVPRVQAGYQEGFHNSLWQAMGNVAALIGLLLAIAREASLPWLVGLMAGLPVAATLANGIHLFGVRRPWLRPRLTSITTVACRRLLRSGSLFFVLQVAAVATFTSDALIIAQLFGTATVPEYSIPMRLFSLAPMLLSMVLSPLWPAYGESLARGDVAWIRKTLVRSLKLSLLATGIPSLILVLLGRPLLSLWVGPNLHVPILLLAGMGLWTMMSGAGESVAMFMNGTNAIRFQAVTASVTCVAAVTAKIAFGHWVGLPGVVLGTLLAYGLCSAVPMSLYIPMLLARLRPANATASTASGQPASLSSQEGSNA